METLVASLDSDETFKLSAHEIHLVVKIGLMASLDDIDHVLLGLNGVRLVLLLLRDRRQRGVAGEGRLLDETVGRSHGGSLTASSKLSSPSTPTVVPLSST